MEHSIQLLESALYYARHGAAVLRDREAMFRDGAQPGGVVEAIADIRAKEAAEQEALAEDYEAALRLLKQV